MKSVKLISNIEKQIEITQRKIQDAKMVNDKSTVNDLNSLHNSLIKMKNRYCMER